MHQHSVQRTCSILGALGTERSTVQRIRGKLTRSALALASDIFINDQVVSANSNKATSVYSALHAFLGDGLVCALAAPVRVPMSLLSVRSKARIFKAPSVAR